MRICVAQIASVVGDVPSNIIKHRVFIENAAKFGVGFIIFPELSLTAYEPKLAKELAIETESELLKEFQVLSETYNVVIGVGTPTPGADGINISMIIFQPNMHRLRYSKRYLHSDEDEFFVSGSNFPILSLNEVKVGIAICYELSIVEHASAAFNSGANFYLASVAKSASGVEKASQRLSEIASTYGVSVMMANGLGFSDNFLSTGNSAVWSETGELLKKLDSEHEGILVYDTETKEIIEKYL